MPLDATSLPAVGPAPIAQPRGRNAPFWRGAAGAVSLALWTVAGVVGAALALFSVALEGGPRGRARATARIRPLEPATPRIVAVPEPAEEPQRAAGEAYPG